MGRLAALILSLAAIGVLTAGLIWLIFAISTRARRTYRRYKNDL